MGGKKVFGIGRRERENSSRPWGKSTASVAASLAEEWERQIGKCQGCLLEAE